MKKTILFLFISGLATSGFAQKVDSIYFHLYTDSLKKGQHNYINVDGKLSNGRWLPLTSKDLEFSCATASFEGNELIIPEDFKDLKVVVTATMKGRPETRIERTIWIKQLPDPALPTRQDMDNRGRKRNRP